MSRLRVISVWVVALSGILVAYRVYNRISKTPVIEVPQAPSAHELPHTEFDGPSIGPATVGKAENARYTFVDEATRQVTRAFGFERLLNTEAGSRQWNLQKPYISMYERTFDCDITAEQGTLTVETVKGNPSPTDGRLRTNVVIRIRTKDTEEPADTFIHLDELNYSSERSEFWTEGPLRITNPRLEMEGRGMVLIYNQAGNRIEFFKMVHLDYLYFKDVASLSSGDSAGQEPSSAGSATPPETAQPKPLEGRSPVAQAGGTTSSLDDLYVCIFSRDVVIKYGGEVKVEGAHEIAVNNILWARSDSKGKTGGKARIATPKPDVRDASSTLATERQEPHSLPCDTLTADAQKGSAAVVNDTGEGERETVSKEAKLTVDVRITCAGGFVAKPLTSVFELVEPGLSGQVSGHVQVSAQMDTLGADFNAIGADGQMGDETTPRALFRGKRITYDMTTGHAVADGPIELTFHTTSDTETDPNATVLPMVVTAEKNAEFFANQDRVIERIVFNENVVGTRRVLTSEYLETSRFHGRTLTTHLESQKESRRNGRISHVAVAEGNVKLDSVRTNASGEAISNVLLVCAGIDYDAAKSIVYATGPGNIQLNNQNAPARPAAGEKNRLNLSGPCFALVRGFDRLTWFTEAMQINADGKDEALRLAYWPIEDGRRGQIYRGSTMHLQANFWPVPDGGSELATIITTGGIHYQEDSGNEFLGEDLLYDAQTGLLVISSSERNACLLNGALVDRIEYDVATGRVQGNLASSPGAITVPGKQ